MVPRVPGARLPKHIVSAWGKACLAYFLEHQSRSRSRDLDDLSFKRYQTPPPGAEWDGCQQNILLQSQCQHQSSALQLTQPFSLGIRIHLGEELSKAGLLAKHKRSRVQVAERANAVTAHSDRWRSDLTAVEPVLRPRYPDLHPIRPFVCFIVAICL